jgi:hypothetical protein
MLVNDLIHDIHNGDIEEVLNIFGGSMEGLLYFLKKKGELDSIDPFDDWLEEYQSKILYTMLIDLGETEVMDYVITRISGDIIKEGDKDYYLTLDGLDEFAEFFSDSGDPNDRNVVKDVMDEDFFEAFGYIDTDFYSDVIENLNEENIKSLKSMMIGNNVEAIVDDEAPTELLYQLSEEQKSNMVQIDSNNIDRIFNDEETLKYVIMVNFEDMMYDMENLYNRSYNNAYEVELSNMIWDELTEYFNVEDKKWFKVKNGHQFMIRINPGVIPNMVIDFLRTTGGEYDYYGTTLDDLGSFTNLLQYLMEEGVYEYLSFRIPDYPDYRLVVKSINDGFNDYF